MHGGEGLVRVELGQKMTRSGRRCSHMDLNCQQWDLSSLEFMKVSGRRPQADFIKRQ